MTNANLPNNSLLLALEQLYKLDRDFIKIEQLAGTLTVRSHPATFNSLIRIILGQQLSTKVADSIFAKLSNSIEVTPENIAACSEADLRAVGLSRAKVNTCKAVADGILQQTLCLDAFADLSNQSIAAQLTQIKGIGTWTADIFLLFCLDRLDVFPASDLAIQVGYQKLKDLPTRPTAQELVKRMESIDPYGGVAAHLLWHYYRYLNQR